MNLPDALEELEKAHESIRQAWDDHDCTDEARAVYELSTAWDDGRADLKKLLLEQIETWKRQEAVGLVTGTMTLDEIESWLRRS